MFVGGSYCRDLAVAPDDPRTIYLASGAGGGAAPPDTVPEGALFRSRDIGETWERLDLGDVPPGRMMQVAIDPSVPSRISCGAYSGEFTAAPTAVRPGARACCQSSHPLATHLPVGLRLGIDFRQRTGRGTAEAPRP